MNRSELEALLAWSPAYDAAWDTAPDEYLASGQVGWGRSRRLARLQLPPASGDPGFKAYLGVQHVDNSRAGWRGFDAPETRFFLSWFAGARCLGLRTFSTTGAALDALWQAYEWHLAAFHGATKDGRP